MRDEPYHIECKKRRAEPSYFKSQLVRNFTHRPRRDLLPPNGLCASPRSGTPRHRCRLRALEQARTDPGLGCGRFPGPKSFWVEVSAIALQLSLSRVDLRRKSIAGRAVPFWNSCRTRIHLFRCTPLFRSLPNPSEWIPVQKRCQILVQDSRNPAQVCMFSKL